MQSIWVGRFRVDLATGEVAGSDSACTLRPMERRLLTVLARSAPDPVARETLEHEVWGHGPGVQSRTLGTTVARLRKKLDPTLVQTVHGYGYRLVLGIEDGNESVDSGVHQALTCIRRRRHRLLVLTGDRSLRRRVATALARLLAAVCYDGALPDSGVVVWHDPPDTARLELSRWIRHGAPNIAIVTRDQPFALMTEWVLEVGP